jgi:hypothetical protein
MKTKTLIIIAVVVLVLAVAGYFLWKKYKPADVTAAKTAALPANTTSVDRAIIDKMLAALKDDNMRAEILRQYAAEKDGRVAGLSAPEAIFKIITFNQNEFKPNTQGTTPELTDWSKAIDAAIVKIFPELQKYRAEQALLTIK